MISAPYETHAPLAAPMAAAELGESADLSRFARAMRNTPIDILTRTISQMCRLGHGFWQDPGTAGTSPRPATHLYEIQLFGQSANGTTPEEAARNWRTCALKQIEGEA